MLLLRIIDHSIDLLFLQYDLGLLNLQNLILEGDLNFTMSPAEIWGQNAKLDSMAFYFHFLDNSLMIFPTHEFLDRFSKCFIHLWGFCYILASQPFWDLWVVSIQFDFPMRDVLFMYIIIHHYSMEGYTPIWSLHSCDSVSFLLSMFFVYDCENS